jgi:uncharacterized caspase-like protein
MPNSLTARIWLLLFLLVPLVQTSVWAQQKPAAQSVPKVALIIGNARYVNAPALPNTENDATDMCAAFLKLGFDVICKHDIASKRAFKDAIYEFTGKITPQTVAVFYFAGHGVQMDGVNYFIPTSAALRTKSDIEDESIQINYLMSELESRQAALNLFMIDACRDNPFADPMRGYVPMLGLASQLYAPRNSIIAMATGPGQLSLDGDGRNGTFTKNLLQNLPTPGQSIEDTLKAVSKGTRADARRLGRQQDPQITMSYADKFCLVGCTDGAARQEALVKSRMAELSRLESTIAKTKAKQAELDAQQALLAKKRGELDALSHGRSGDQSKTQETEQYRAMVAQREQELEKLNADIKASTSQLGELEAIRADLLKKQDDVDHMRRSLAVQQASLEAKTKEIQTRSLQVPDKTAPVNIVPAF